MKFSDVAVLELLKATNGLDLDYGTQKVHYQRKTLLITHHGPVTVHPTVAPPFLASADSAHPRGGDLILRIISKAEKPTPSSENPRMSKHEKSPRSRKRARNPL